MSLPVVRPQVLNLFGTPLVIEQSPRKLHLTPEMDFATLVGAWQVLALGSIVVGATPSLALARTAQTPNY